MNTSDNILNLPILLMIVIIITSKAKRFHTDNNRTDIMKKTIAALTLIATMLVPALAMASRSDYQDYSHTYPVSQSNAHHVNTAE